MGMYSTLLIWINWTINLYQHPKYYVKSCSWIELRLGFWLQEVKQMDMWASACHDPWHGQSSISVTCPGLGMLLLHMWVCIYSRATQYVIFITGMIKIYTVALSLGYNATTLIIITQCFLVTHMLHIHQWTGDLVQLLSNIIASYPGNLDVFQESEDNSRYWSPGWRCAPAYLI